MKFIIFFPLAIIILLLAPIVFFFAYFLPQRWKVQIVKLPLKIWCKSLLLSFGIKLHYHKKQFPPFTKKPLLILSNHQSYIDIILLIYLFQCGFILKSSLMFTLSVGMLDFLALYRYTAPIFLALKKLEKNVKID